MEKGAMVGMRRLFLHHELNELVVVDPAITILIRLTDHLVNLVVGQLLADGSHDVAELSGGNEAVVVAVEDLEGLTDLLLGISVLHFTSHHGEEFWEVNGAVVVGVHLVDHIL